MAFPTSILPDMDMSSVIKKFSHLRSLNASGARVEYLPSTVGNLHHLRYLNLSNTLICTLPDTICSLSNLEILNLNNCYELVRLPKHMRRMQDLRHVYLEGCRSLSEMPPKIGELASLRTWSVFTVGHEKGNHLEELQWLNLGVTLEIKHLERVKSHVDAKKANLVGKQNLRNLRLEWEEGFAPRLEENEYEKILEVLEPHPNLKVLEIWGFKGKQFPRWMENSTLVKLDIRRCPNCLHLLQILGDLPSLKALILWTLGMEYIIEDDLVVGVNSLKPKFVSLESLDLYDLPNLKGLFKDETGHFFSNLHSLTIEECFSLELPHLPSLKQLLLANCSSMNLAAISKLHNLETLRVSNYEEGVEFPSETFKYLHNLTSLDMDGLAINEDLQFLTSLQNLYLSRLPHELTSLPDGLGKCTSLSRLDIEDCPKLESFPDSLKELGNLITLTIHFCPKLKKWCEKKKGEDDWYKIVYIGEW